MERLRIVLNSEELAALRRLSEREVRPVIDQVRIIVRERLLAAGLLSEGTEHDH